MTTPTQKFVQQFIQFLHNEASKGSHNPEQISIITQLLASEFNVNSEPDTSVETNLINSAIQAAASLPEPVQNVENDPKFLEFITLIKQKGYFKNVEEGTPAYQERYQKAKEKFLSRAQESKVVTAEKYKDEGNQLLKQKKLTEAIACYQKAAELNPNNSVYYGNMAAAYLQQGDLNNTVKCAQKSIEVDPKYAKAYKWLGMALSKQEKYAEALKAFETGKDLDPTNTDYEARISEIKVKMQKKSPAAPSQPQMPFGFPNLGAGGMPNVMELMNNPDFMQMAQSIMQNPQFQSLASNLMRSFGGGGDAENMQTPDFEQLATLPEVKENPKLQAILEEIKQQGPSAFAKYQSDPDFAALLQKVGEQFMQKNPMMQNMMESMMRGFGGPKEGEDEDEDPNTQNLYS
jgi:small glutamine-rich tetratricopeptide repeat-containing protein alpha